MEHKIGEIFQYNDEGNIVTLQVTEDKIRNCKGCFFNSERYCHNTFNDTGYCSKFKRIDNSYVIFKPIIVNNEK